jgi:iron(III) transport system permease protein
MRKLRKAREQHSREFLLLLKQPGLLITIILTLGVLVLFCIYPIFRVFLATLVDDNGKFSLAFVSKAIQSHHYVESLLNSIKLGVVVSILGTLVGYLFAFSISRTEIRGKKFFHIMAMLPILSPPFVISLAVILLFGRSGVITKQLFHITDNNVYGFTSLMVVQTLALFPLAYLNLKGILETIDGSVENAARSLGSSRWQVFTKVTLPLSLPGILSALLIVFAKSISDFGNPQILAGDFATLSVQAYIQITGIYDLRTGAFMALSILLPSMLAFFIQKYWTAKKSFVTVTGKPVGGFHMIGEKHIVYPLLFGCIAVSALILLFYGTVVWIAFVKTWGVDMSLSLRNFQFVFKRGLKAMRDTLFLSLIATPITAFFGLIIAFLLVRKEFIGKKIMQFSSMIPFTVPGIVLGIGYILAFNQKPFLLTGTATIIIAALMFRNLSIGVEAGTNSLRQIDPAIEEASQILGANNFTTFTKISLPLMRSALYSGLLNAFVRSMTSISAIIFLVSINWNLLTVSILSEIESSRLGVASAYCVVLMVIVLVAFGVLDLLVNRRSKRGWSNNE